MPALAGAPAILSAAERPGSLIRRARPGDPAWPSRASWESLNRQVGGRLLEVESPLSLCRAAPTSAACEEHLTRLRNPYYIGDHPALTQSSGYLDAWTSSPSAYAIAAVETTERRRGGELCT